jgi:hypothetical protein
MNTIPNSLRAASPAAQSFPSSFLQNTGGDFAVSTPAIAHTARTARKASGVSAMSYYGKVRTRVPYASALYAAAMAALLSACAQSDVTPAPEAAIVQPAEQGTDANADMPTVVITAARERPKAIG